MDCLQFATKNQNQSKIPTARIIKADEILLESNRLAYDKHRDNKCQN